MSTPIISCNLETVVVLYFRCISRLEKGKNIFSVSVRTSSLSLFVFTNLTPSSIRAG